MLTFGVFETDSGYEEIRERYSKFSQFHELSAIENNFPFRFCDQKLFNKLITQADVVYEPFSEQVCTTLDALREVVSQDEAQIFQTGDLLTTEHSTLTLTKTLVIGLISQQQIDRCHVYIDILSKFFKACFSFYSEQIDIVFVPLDFLMAHACRLTNEKVGKLVRKIVVLLKQVIYEVSM